MIMLLIILVGPLFLIAGIVNFGMQKDRRIKELQTIVCSLEQELSYKRSFPEVNKEIIHTNETLDKAKEMIVTLIKSNGGKIEYGKLKLDMIEYFNDKTDELVSDLVGSNVVKHNLNSDNFKEYLEV